MPIQSMQCPKCGHWATEYDDNKWQCLDCHTKFVYEPPHKPDSLVQQTVSMDSDGIIYVCDICGLRVSRLAKPDQKCTECGEHSICPDCYPKNANICRECKEKRAGQQIMVGGAVVLIAICIALFMSVYISIQDCQQNKFEEKYSSGLSVNKIYELKIPMYTSKNIDMYNRLAALLSGQYDYNTQLLPLIESGNVVYLDFNTEIIIVDMMPSVEHPDLCLVTTSQNRRVHYYLRKTWLARTSEVVRR